MKEKDLYVNLNEKGKQQIDSYNWDVNNCQLGSSNKGQRQNYSIKEICILFINYGL